MIRCQGEKATEPGLQRTYEEFARSGVLTPTLQRPRDEGAEDPPARRRTVLMGEEC